MREVARQILDVVRKSYDLGRGTLLDVIAEGVARAGIKTATVAATEASGPQE